MWAIQTIIFGDKKGADLLQDLQLARKYGFDTVEINHFQLPELDADLVAFNRSVERIGLSIEAIHCGLPRLNAEADCSRIVRAMTLVNARFLIVSGVNGGGHSYKGYEATGALLAPMGKRLRNLGKRLLYHPYDGDLSVTQTGKCGVPAVLQSSEESIGLVYDTYWAALGERSMSTIWEANSSTIEVFHLKDGDPKTWAFRALGTGTINLEFARHLIAQAPSSVLFVFEQDVPGPQGLEESIRISSEFMLRIKTGGR